VPSDGSHERHGEVFDAVAEAYDRERPSYPPALVDEACATGGLPPGAPVLEVGCGTGKLTEALVERGLSVDAVDPGANMIAFARGRTGAAARFHVGRFEDVAFPDACFDAVFSATAFHWVDPLVGWAKAARLLRPGGMLALIMFITYLDAETGPNDRAIHEVFLRHLPADHGIWRPLRDLPTLRAGFEERSDDVSAVLTWLGHHDLTSPDAPSLFRDVRLTTAIDRREQTADQLWALFETTSAFPRVEPAARAALERELRETIDRLGGTLRSNELAVLVTARAA
jgi:ubiquinone/menaquinone biosynthesis C-methylase UbiE